MSADADPGRDLPAHAKHAFSHVRFVQQRHFETAREIYRAIFHNYRQVQNSRYLYTIGHIPTRIRRVNRRF